MSVVPILVFVVLVSVAAGFACWPILRERLDNGAARGLLAGAVALVVLGIGMGVYLMLGMPDLALRSFQPLQINNVRALVAMLATRVRQTPDDPRGWLLLGKGYLTLGDPGDAAAAFRRAIPVATPRQRPALLSAEGEALTLAAGGIVTPEAEALFDDALRLDPKDPAARYYVGLAFAMRGDKAHALLLWQSLLADSLPGAPWRGVLVDRIAALTAQGGAAPDIGAMVAALAERLQQHPNDPEGWNRLVRAYVVLGDRARARSALANARIALKSNAQALAALSAEAKSLKLEK